MYKVYVLKSINYGKYYIGHTKDLSDRVRRHNSGQTRSTKAYKPWTIVYTEHKLTKSEAYIREMEIKKYKGGIQFKDLLNNNVYGEVA